MKKIAVIGAGISGLSVTYALRHTHAMTLFELEPRLGGHSRTIDLPNGLEVDTGFIVLNDRNYPNLLKLFHHLEVPIEKTDMTFSVSHNKGDLEWSGTSIGSLFAQKQNLFNPSMLKGLLDVLKFNARGLSYATAHPHLTLGELLKELHLGEWFQKFYVLPMGGAIWSTPDTKIMDFPALPFLKFFENHGLLSLTNRPQWYTLRHKSRDYVGKLESSLQGAATIHKSARLSSIQPLEKGWQISFQDQVATFDEVIFATHPEIILQLLENPASQTQEVLKLFKRVRNLVVTHTDSRQMPLRTKCWSSWNYLSQDTLGSDKLSVTYWMNELQHLPKEHSIFVTLNPLEKIPAEFIYDQKEFFHPLYDTNAILGQQKMQDLQGKNNLWFCGAYLRNGFHEDGLWSAQNVAEKLGWRGEW